ncbi:MAG: hypothetical protein KGJ43_00700 [Acidobacteriota bacterium]|nr:hypothetical protein [Acidobacteriota bacterium]
MSLWGGAASRSVTTPSGAQWRVGRRWIGRGLPRWRRISVRGAGANTADAISYMPDFGNIDDLGLELAILVGALVVAVVIVPLLLFGIELIAVGLAFAGAMVARGLLGRPWVVYARPTGSSGEGHVWRVKGWRRSARMIEQVAAVLGAGGDPSSAAVSNAAVTGD